MSFETSPQRIVYYQFSFNSQKAFSTLSRARLLGIYPIPYPLSFHGEERSFWLGLACLVSRESLKSMLCPSEHIAAYSVLAAVEE